MSTPSRSDTKTAAKRRAAARQRRRVLLRQIGAIFFVAIFVLGTATTIFVAQSVQPSSTASTVPTQAPTESAGAAITQLQQQAQQAEAKQDWAAASGYYLAAADLSPSNATLHYGAGKALVNKGDYTKGVAELQKAIELNPDATFAAEAKSLIDKYKGNITPGATGAVTGTTTISSTGTITK